MVPLRPLSAGDDDSHPLGLFDDSEKLVNIDLVDPIKKLKAKAAPDHCGDCQRELFVLVEPLQSAADD
jgi:hypothetical protein